MPVELLEFASRALASAAAAEALGRQLQTAAQAGQRPRLLLPGGNTPRDLLPLLAALPLDWSRVLASPTDERWVPPDSPESNLQMLREGLPAACWLDPRQQDEPWAAAAAWGAHLRDWRPFSAVLLGMGEDGHFASLFAGMPGLAAALDIDLPGSAVVASAALASPLRLSLNLSLLLNTQWLGVLAFGARKGQLLEQVLANAAQSRELPVYGLLHQQRVPLTIYWAP